MLSSAADIIEVRRLDRQWAEDATRGDTVALGRIFADELRYVHMTGAIDTKQTLMSAIESRDVVYDSIDSEDVDVRVIGDAAVLTSRTRLQIRTGGRKDSFQGQFLRVYLRGNGGWQLAFHQGTRLPQNSE